MVTLPIGTVGEDRDGDVLNQRIAVEAPQLDVARAVGAVGTVVRERAVGDDHLGGRIGRRSALHEHAVSAGPMDVDVVERERANVRVLDVDADALVRR
jgi:hypothetical protein